MYNERVVKTREEAHKVICDVGYPVFVTPVISEHPGEEDIDVLYDEEDFNNKVAYLISLSKIGQIKITKEE